MTADEASTSSAPCSTLSGAFAERLSSAAGSDWCHLRLGIAEDLVNLMMCTCMGGVCNGVHFYTPAFKLDTSPVNTE